MARFILAKGGVKLEIEGADKLGQMFHDLPERFSKKVLIPVLRKGGNIINAEVKKQVPSNIKGVKAALSTAVIGKDETPGVVAGFFRRKRYFSNKTGVKRKADLRGKGDKKFDAATIAYWFNYGTMANRSGAHAFRTPRKGPRKSAKGGIRPLLFFQKGVLAGFKKANESVTKDLDLIFANEFEKLNR
jgi:hypothetical protein